MLTTIIALFSSGGVGSLIGMVGGLLNRQVDLKAKKIDHEHELAQMAAQQKYLEAENEQRSKMALIEADSKLVEATAAVETAGYGAMAASYGYAKTSAEDGWVDKASKAVRPLLTVAFILFTLFIFANILELMETSKIAPKADDIYLMWRQCIEWVLFQAGVCTGWWFSMRPGKLPDTRK